ncbi:MAG: glycosyltransferase family 4 protein [Acidimicrobiia bacterium]|nr:glycosyltransferase family 4 protein [Acidimicrobiia bacterium]
MTWFVAPRNRYDDGGSLAIPDHLASRVTGVLCCAPTRTRLATAARWRCSQLPWPLAAGDWSRAEAELGRRAPRADLLWVMGIDALRAAKRAGVQAAATVVDMDLESLKLARMLAIDPPANPIRRWIARVDVDRWRRLERQAVGSGAVVSLCSSAERDAFGAPAWVVDNSYPDPGPPPVTGLGDGPPTLVLVGSFAYQPNNDGLAWLLEGVWPTIRAAKPEAELRLVGRGLAADHPARSTPGVTVLDHVADVTPELRRATVAVVPVLWGAGTRVKIIEAFAHHVPVVSTTVGAEGLAVEPGRHLLIADTPRQFAAACLSALADPPTASRLADAGYGLFRQRYEEGVVIHGLTELVRELLAERRRQPGEQG